MGELGCVLHVCSAGAGAAGAAVRGEPVGKAALAGARFGAIMYSANYLVGLWSGWSVDRAEVLYNEETNPQQILGGRIGVNGVATPRASAIRTMDEFSYDAWIYNPTHGPMALGDIVEAVQEHLFGPSSWSRSAAPLLNQAARSGAVIHLVAHSQGGIQLAQALSLMDPEVSFAPGSSVAFVKTNQDPFSAGRVALAHGLAVSYTAHPFDIVSAIGSPWLVPTAVVSLPVYILSGAEAHTVDVWNR